MKKYDSLIDNPNEIYHVGDKNIMTGLFLDIVDPRPEDLIRYKNLKERFEISDRDMLKRLLDCFYDNLYKLDTCIPHRPPCHHHDHCHRPPCKESVIEIHNDFEFSLQPGNVAYKSFGVFNVGIEYNESRDIKILSLKFDDINKVVRDFTKIIIQRYDNSMKELYKVDLRKSKERTIIMDLSDLDIRLNEHVKIRVVYDIFGTEIKLVEK